MRLSRARVLTIIEIGVPQPAEPPRAQWSSFSLSLIVHVVVLFLAIMLPDGKSKVPVARFRVEMLPNPNVDRKVVWYRREDLPTLSAADNKASKGLTTSKNETLVTSEKSAELSRQFVLQPELKKIEEIQSPNLVAFQPPVRPAPKAFVPPVLREMRAVEAMSVDAPPDLLTANTPLINLPKLVIPQPAKPLKRFVAPPERIAAPSKQGPDISAPDLPTQSPNLANLSAVVVGLNPSPKVDSVIPPGSRPADFSRAPVSGENTAGGASGPRVAGLATRGEQAAGERVPVTSSNRDTPKRVVKELQPPAMSLTVSAPLRPSARRVPPGVEAGFAGRNVYVLVVQRPALPDYGGDWTIWFGEGANEPVGNQQIRPPYPVRKRDILASSAVDASSGAEARVSLAAQIRADGTVWGIRVLGARTNLAEQAAEDLGKWEFRPATRAGQPIAIDVIVELPFRGAAAGRQ